VVSFKPRPLYSPGKDLRYLLDRWLGGPQDWSGRFEENKNLVGVRALLNSILYIRVGKILYFEEEIMIHGMATVFFILKPLLI
jgi:hypothetical protein